MKKTTAGRSAPRDDGAYLRRFVVLVFFALVFFDLVFFFAGMFADSSVRIARAGEPATREGLE